MATDTSSDKDTNVLNRSGLNPRRACMKRALTLLACVCKPAAANLTSNNERSQAWHSATDWMRPSPSDPVRSTRHQLHAACVSAVTVPVLNGPVCAARARSHRALRPTERRLQTVAAARRQGRRWRRTKVPWA